MQSQKLKTKKQKSYSIIDDGNLRGIIAPRDLISREQLDLLIDDLNNIIAQKTSKDTDDIIVKRTIKTRKEDKDFYDNLDQELTESLKSIGKEEYSGPFNQKDSLKFLQSLQE